MTNYAAREPGTTSVAMSTAEVQARLRTFVNAACDEIEGAAREMAGLWADELEAAAHWHFASETASLSTALRAWLEALLLQDDSGTPSQVPWTGASLAAKQPLLIRGFALARRRLLRACGKLDPGLVDHVLDALDTELERIIAADQQVLTRHLAAFDRFAELGQLVASVGHELRNPLSAIEASAYILSRRLEPSVNGDSDIVKHLAKIRRNIEVASRTSRALLGWAKQQIPRCFETPLLACIDPVLRDLNCPAGVCIQLDIPERLDVWADADLLAVVLRNLVSNAIESLVGGGTVRIVASQDAGGTCVVVSDNGPGVPAAERQRIFEPLHSSKCHGTGLGLPLCKRIAVAHGGRLSLDPSECGASFRLWLPNRVGEAKGSGMDEPCSDTDEEPR